MKLFSRQENFSTILPQTYFGLHVTCLTLRIYKDLIFSTYFNRSPQYQISQKSFRQEPNCSMRTDMKIRTRQSKKLLFVTLRKLLKSVSTNRPRLLHPLHTHTRAHTHHIPTVRHDTALLGAGANLHLNYWCERRY